MSQAITLEASWPVTPLLAGIHHPGMMRRHADRVMGCFELIFVQDGVLPLGEAGVNFEVPPGETLLLWPGRRHYSHRDFDPTVWFYWLTFTHRSGGAGSATGPRLPQRARPQDPRWLVALFERFLAKQAADQLSGGRGEALAACVLHELTEPPVPVSRETSGSVLAKRALNYIETHLTREQPLSTAEIAAAFRCHPDYLGRVFRQATGRGVIEHIHRERVRLAQRLLSETGDPVELVASACGCNDVRYFRRLFKRYAGCSPGVYRAQATGGGMPRPASH